MHTSIGHQLTAVKTGYPPTSITWPYRGLRSWPIKVKYFLKLSADKLLVFKWSQAQVWFFFIHMKYVLFLGRTTKIFTDLGPENSASYYRQDSFFWRCSPWSRVGHTLRPFFMLWLVKIWQVNSCGKFMQHLESCLLWQLKLREFCVNLSCF